jgi:hypothetical protein
MARKRTTITKEIIEQTFVLASKGASNSAIFEMLGYTSSTLARNKALSSAVQRGRNKARELTLELWIAKLNGKDSIFIQETAKRLRLFVDPVPIEKPTDIKSALKALSDITELYAQNKCSMSQAKTLQSMLKEYVQITETSLLEARIIELEAIASVREEKNK